MRKRTYSPWEEDSSHVCVDCGSQGCWGQCRIRDEVGRKAEINAGLSEPPEPEQKADAAD